MNFTAKGKTGQFDNPAKDSGLDPGERVDSFKQGNNIITVYFRQVPGEACGGECEGGLDKRQGGTVFRRLLKELGGGDGAFSEAAQVARGENHLRILLSVPPQTAVKPAHNTLWRLELPGRRREVGGPCDSAKF